GRSAPRDLFRAGVRTSSECLMSMAAAARGPELGRARPAVQVETELESIAVQAEDPVVPVPRLGPCDEFDVDLVRVRLDVDVEDALVRRFRRFGTEAVAVDEQSG